MPPNWLTARTFSLRAPADIYLALHSWQYALRRSFEPESPTDRAKRLNEAVTESSGDAEYRFEGAGHSYSLSPMFGKCRSPRLVSHAPCGLLNVEPWQSV